MIRIPFCLERDFGFWCKYTDIDKNRWIQLMFFSMFFFPNFRCQVFPFERPRKNPEPLASLSHPESFAPVSRKRTGLQNQHNSFFLGSFKECPFHWESNGTLDVGVPWDEEFEDGDACWENSYHGRKKSPKTWSWAMFCLLHGYILFKNLTFSTKWY